jgi:hypothetical protein
MSSFCTTHKSSVSTGFTEQILPILRILCYNGSLVTWTVVSFITAKFKPLKPLPFERVCLVLGLSWQVWTKPWHDVSLRCFCPSVSLCGTNFARIILFRKSSWRVWWIVSLLMFNSSFWEPIDVSWHHFTDICGCVCISRRWGTTLLGASSRSSRPSLNRLNHSNTIKETRVRKSIATRSLIYQLESFSSCFARLETKLNIRSLLHHYDLHGKKNR